MSRSTIIEKNGLTYKTCSKCQKEKLIDEFSFCDKERGLYESACRLCKREQYLASNPNRRRSSVIEKDGITYRTCPKCKRTKPINEFSYRCKSKGLRQCYCKSCRINSYIASHPDGQRKKKEIKIIIGQKYENILVLDFDRSRTGYYQCQCCICNEIFSVRDGHLKKPLKEAACKKCGSKRRGINLSLSGKLRKEKAQDGWELEKCLEHFFTQSNVVQQLEI